MRKSTPSPAASAAVVRSIPFRKYQAQPRKSGLIHLFNILNIISAKSASYKMNAAKTVQRKLREAQGESTHRAFAKRLGISIGTLARLRNSPQNVTLYTVEKISRALGVTPSQFLDDGDTRHRKR